MHFPDFKLLPVPQQAALCKSGVYLAERTGGIAVYALHDYHVEVYYRLRDRELVMLIGFYDPALSGPCLKKLNQRGCCRFTGVHKLLQGQAGK